MYSQNMVPAEMLVSAISSFKRIKNRCFPSIREIRESQDNPNAMPIPSQKPQEI